MNIIPIKKLEPGDTIGLFSSSSPTSAKSVNNIKKYFEGKGYLIKTSPHIYESNGYMAGSARARADDLNELVADDNIRMIMTANGGKSALQMLPYIDYDLIQKKQKGIIGLSDPSIILNAITARTGVITLHGPNGYNFGDSQITKFSEENWWNIVTGKQTDIGLGADVAVIKGNTDVTGRLYGGHLGTIRNLIGTRWEPDWNSSILFLEEAFSDISLFDTMLTHLNYCGILGKINGLIVGKLEQCHESNYAVRESLQEIILRNCAEYDFPVIMNAWIGHTDDKVTLPIGTMGKLCLSKGKLELLENYSC